MKNKILLSFCLFFFILNTSGQTPCGNCNQIKQLDDKIYKKDRKLPGRPATSIKALLNQLLSNLTLTDPSLLEEELYMINHVETITWLEFYILDMEENSLKRMRGTHGYGGFLGNISPFILRETRKKIEKRLDELMQEEFTFYQFTETSKKPVKYVYAEHGNDFFHFIKQNVNDDRDMTGSFRVEVGTDLFKMRLFSSTTESIFNINSRNWYTYQTLFYGGEGYTPYLRDTVTFNNPKSIDSNDRPYASFVYFGRGKERIYRKGSYKISSEIKVGTIGSENPGGVQSVIHRDLLVGSVTPNGWESQVAHGGRLAFNYDFTHEAMLVNRRWLLSTPQEYGEKMDFVNVSTFVEGKIGHDMTSFGGGLNFSTNSFMEAGPKYMPFSKLKKNSRPKFAKIGVTFNYRYTFRHVFHNSMLEGYGILKHCPDEDPNSPIDAWRLKDNQMQRNVHIHDFWLNLRFKYVGIVIRQQFMSPEYDLPVNSVNYELGENTSKGNHNRSPWNHVGHFGLIFNVQ